MGTTASSTPETFLYSCHRDTGKSSEPRYLTFVQNCLSRSVLAPGCTNSNDWRTRPLLSMTAEMPMLTLRATLRRHSTARKRQTAKCSSCSLLPSNQPSLEMLSRKSTAGRPSPPPYLRIGVFITNKSAEGEILLRSDANEREARMLRSRPDAVIEIVRREVI